MYDFNMIREHHTGEPVEIDWEGIKAQAPGRSGWVEYYEFSDAQRAARALRLWLVATVRIDKVPYVPKQAQQIDVTQAEAGPVKMSWVWRVSFEIPDDAEKEPGRQADKAHRLARHLENVPQEERAKKAQKFRDNEAHQEAEAAMRAQLSSH